jgi:abnormal spindle-like microcephaly-associated protein
VKSSVDVTRKLSKLCLAGEGDIIRRLESITKSHLSQLQYPLDDFQYNISNLATDLRDGVRLTRLVEVLSGRDDCSQQLRWPAVGVSQRIHNLSIALTSIQEEGIKLDMDDGEIISASDIERGNREKTLFLLWQLISRWQLPQYLKDIHIKEEIKSLKRIIKLRKETLPMVEVFSILEICSELY